MPKNSQAFVFIFYAARICTLPPLDDHAPCGNESSSTRRLAAVLVFLFRGKNLIEQWKNLPGALVHGSQPLDTIGKEVLIRTLR